jgi:hypothetical protein
MRGKPATAPHGFVAKAVVDIRSTGRTITVFRPIVREVIDRHPEQPDLVVTHIPRSENWLQEGAL